MSHFFFYIALFAVIFVDNEAQLIRNYTEPFGNTSDGQTTDTGRYKRDIPWRSTLRIKIKDGHSPVSVHLKATKQRLANEFLPIQSAYGSPQHIKFNLEHEAMELFGRFTMYQDFKKKAALIHFHKDDVLTGVIGYEYIINNLPFDEVDRIQIVGGPYVTKRPTEYLATFDASIPDEKVDLPPVTVEEISFTNAKHSYPELFIIVGYDLVRQYPRKPGDDFQYHQLLAYILCHFNAVDMLYSTLKDPTIELNIARIIIETAPDVLGIAESFADSPTRLNTMNVLINVGTYIHFDKRFPPDTFDRVLYLTGLQLSRQKMDRTSLYDVEGTALPGFYGDYKIRMENSESADPFSRTHQSILAFRLKPDYENFPTAAHELAHLFGTGHDELPALKPAKCAFLMQKISDYTSDCLRWSDRSIKSIQRYFRTKDQCFLLNYPRSLARPHPKKIFEKYEQCRCYGFDCSSSTCKWDNKVDRCNRPMKCWRKRTGRYEDVPIPMDGTPCGHKKVCWMGECIQAMGKL